MQAITLSEKLGQFTTHWDPHVVAGYNGNDVMVVRFQGAFDFHVHEGTDDFFYVLSGVMHMDYQDAPSVTVRAGDVCVVPRGVVHRPRAEGEVHVMLIEPAGEPNTGDPATAAAKPRI